jgi:hypothetical protein
MVNPYIWRRLMTPLLGPLAQISRQVENLGRARAFLTKIGVSELFAFPPMAFFDLGGTHLMLKETGQRETADILYFRSIDIHADHQRLAGLGIEFKQDLQMIHRHADGTEEWMAFFADDEERPLALVQQTRPT